MTRGWRAADPSLTVTAVIRHQTLVSLTCARRQGAVCMGTVAEGQHKHLDQVLGEGASIDDGVLRAADLGRRDQLHGVRDLHRVLHGVDPALELLLAGHDLRGEGRRSLTWRC